MDTQRAIDVGKFVLAAYAALDHSPNKKDPRPPVTLPDPDYEFVAWLTMEDFVFRAGDDRERRFYGFLAHKQNTEQYIVALRGTEGPREWWDDFHVLLVPYREAGDEGQVAYGFSSIYRTLDIHYVGAAAQAQAVAALGQLPGHNGKRNGAAGGGSFAKRLGAVVKTHRAHRHNQKHPDQPIRAVDVDLSQTQLTITGHSLGAALATLFAVDNSQSPDPDRMMQREIYTFASPKVGDKVFAARFDRLPGEKWRIYNVPDIVTMVPFAIEGFAHVDTAYGVDTRLADEVKWTIPCWHLMDSYLSALGLPLDRSSKCHTLQGDGLEANLLAEARRLARRALGLPQPPVAVEAPAGGG
jgi:hypothetical protein